MTTNYSVLMSLYYKEKPDQLMESIDSMLEQTLKPSEFVVVKDGPLTPELDQIIDSYVEGNPELFRILSLKENIGLGKALDKGIKLCSNELIARMDADDISLKTRCEKQIKFMNENPEVDILGTWIDEFYDNPNNIISSRIVPTNSKEIYTFMKRRSPFNHPTVMYKKSEVLRVGGYGKMKRKQDLDLFSRMINNGCIGANLAESLLLFRSDEGNFRRRKSWSYCKSYIEVQWQIWKRGDCSLIDLLYVIGGQMVIFIAPLPLIKYISNRFLRNSAV